MKPSKHIWEFCTFLTLPFFYVLWDIVLCARDLCNYGCWPCSSQYLLSHFWSRLSGPLARFLMFNEFLVGFQPLKLLTFLMTFGQHCSCPIVYTVLFAHHWAWQMSCIMESASGLSSSAGLINTDSFVVLYFRKETIVWNNPPSSVTRDTWRGKGINVCIQIQIKI